MNLVAKKFVAARDDEQGALILSTFAGASRELSEALMVNPYGTHAMAEALEQALLMPPGEQRERMRLMRDLVRIRNVYRWAGQMLLDAASSKSPRMLRSIPPVKPIYPDDRHPNRRDTATPGRLSPIRARPRRQERRFADTSGRKSQPTAVDRKMTAMNSPRATWAAAPEGPSWRPRDRLFGTRGAISPRQGAGPTIILNTLPWTAGSGWSNPSLT